MASPFNPTILPSPPAPQLGRSAPLSRSLARDIFGREIGEPDPPPQAGPFAPSDPPKTKREMATESIARRAGALADELDFPAFVASLVHGTFDAIVDSSIRQMESFADLVSAVAKPVDQFAQENVTLNQVRDWMVEQYPHDVALDLGSGEPALVPRAQPVPEGEDEAPPPAWLADFGMDGEELTGELLEGSILPLARGKVAQHRLQTLATMVLLGMNRVIVKDGTIAARLRFRAAAADHAAVQYATGEDPGTGATEWGERGSRSHDIASTKVSTVGVNVQSDSELKAELFGEVKINFASETVPLDRFIDEAQRSLLERHARTKPRAVAPAAAPPAAAPPLIATPLPPPPPAPGAPT